MWDDLLIEQLERAKVMLYQESLTSIAFDGIALLTLLLASQAAACMSARRRARAPADPRHITLIQKINIKRPGG
jgi:hypothetical protein